MFADAFWIVFVRWENHAAGKSVVTSYADWLQNIFVHLSPYALFFLARLTFLFVLI